MPYEQTVIKAIKGYLGLDDSVSLETDLISEYDIDEIDTNHMVSALERDMDIEFDTDIVQDWFYKGIFSLRDILDYIAFQREVKI